MKLYLITFIFILSSIATALELSPLFSDHAVIQRDQAVPVWGWDEPGAKVTVEFAGQKVDAVADHSGKWIAKLQPLNLNKKPQEMTVSAGSEKLVRTGILVGDVWLCSGQSNMEMTFKAKRLECDMPDFVKPDEVPMVRHLKVAPVRTKKLPKEVTETPQSKFQSGQIKGGWVSADAESYKAFTATGFFFAYTVHKETGVPIGLVNCTQGNTRIDQWMSKAAGESIADKVPADKLKGVYNSPPHLNFNTVISPVAGFAIKGTLWYQGEANGKESDEYYWKLKALIDGWRADWGQGDFPFYFVQLPSYNGKKSWAGIREAQRRVHAEVANTGMVVLTDAGDNTAEFPINLHPRNKYIVGKRLALWALAKNYGKDIVHSGPLFKKAEFKEGQVMVAFDHLGGGLMAAHKESSRSQNDPKPVDEIIGFEVAGKDKQWVKAKARIVGDHLIVSADEVKAPVAVRYLSAMNTDHGTLYNKAGLPASPFAAAPPSTQKP